MNNVELLAPAGSADAGFAALEYGADAIYLGLPQFSARAEAVNFTLDEFYNIVGYAHSLGKKVYVTLNTVIKEIELPAVIQTISEIAQAQADALIVQDLGVIRLINNYFPELRVHASTQMAIHNRAGAEYLLNMGIKRVTLARELSFDEIADISTIDGLETESFLHGALCYSYSGLCMFSSMHSGRSANRGRCAYSCREVFTQDELKLEGHAFSLRDLELSGNLDQLLATGVNSLKIEGRKKSPLYVAAVVKLYRELLDKTCTEAEAAVNSRNVETIFSRQTCEYFTAGARSGAGRADSLDTEAVGHRGTNIGIAEKISRRGKEQLLTFKTELAFEKHDGLQIDDPANERPFGFPVNDLTVKLPNGRERTSFEAKAGDIVTVLLPADTPTGLQGQKIYLSSSQLLKREFKWHTPKQSEFNRRYNLAINLTVEPDGLTAVASISDPLPGIESITASKSYRHTEHFDEARNPEQSYKGISNNFSKTGSTPFTMQDFTLEGLDNLFIPASVSNNLRRELYEELTRKLQQGLAKKIAAITTTALKKNPLDTTDLEKKWLIKLDKHNSIQDLQNLDRELLDNIHELIIEINPETDAAQLIEELDRFADNFPTISIRLALPLVAREHEQMRLAIIITQLKNCGFQKWQTGNLWGLHVLQQHEDIEISGSFTLYALNTQSIREQLQLGLTELTLSVEDEKNNIIKLLKSHGDSLIVTVYQDTPLFIGEACSYSAFANGCPTGCKEQNSSREWQSSRGLSYTMQKDNCRTILIRRKAFSISGKLAELPAMKCAEIDFINRSYTSEEMTNVITALFNDEAIPETHTGNFASKLL